jgi:hypothetical protein
VVEGGAYVDKKAFDASADALTKSDEEKAAAAEKKARKQAKKDAMAPAEEPAAPSSDASSEMLPEPVRD